MSLAGTSVPAPSADECMSVLLCSLESHCTQADKPVVVDFWATWCGPCKLIEPLMKKLQEENTDTLKVVKIEVDANKDIVEEYEVSSRVNISE
jgi:thioredoxin 1